MKELLFIDTETGGIDPKETSLLTVGLARWVDGKIEETKELKIKADIYHLTGKAMEINGIQLPIHDAEAVYPYTAFEDLHKWITGCFSEGPVTAVGHNVAFDMAFMQQIAPKQILDTIISYRTIDTAAILRYLHLSGVLEEDIRGIAQALEYFGIPWDKPHDALSDALATAELFNTLVGLVGHIPYAERKLME